MRTLDLPAFLVFFALAWQVTAADTGPTPKIHVEGGRRFLAVGEKRLLEPGAPWLATSDWQQVRTFPLSSPELPKVKGDQREPGFAGEEACALPLATSAAINAPVRRENIDGAMRLTCTDSGTHGSWTERVTVKGDVLTIRYEFDFADVPSAANLQWYWRLDPAIFDAADDGGRHRPAGYAAAARRSGARGRQAARPGARRR